jgi:Fic family protein
MIDRSDFPIRTPAQRLAEAKRLMQLPSMAAFEEEGRKYEQRREYLYNKYILERANANLIGLDLESLLERFEEISLVADEVLKDTSNDGIRKYSACYDALDAVGEELKARGPAARRLLMRFYDHFNHQVRLKAAIYSYGVAPQAARRCLEELSKIQMPDVSLDAGMTLRAIDDGTLALD